MDKRGASLIVASVLLILLAVTLATVIYLNMREVISLSPIKLDCYGLDFKAEIVQEPTVDYLDVVNIGNLQIEGFYIKLFREGELDVYEEVYKTLEPGRTDRIVLTKDYGSGKYLIVPRVEGEDPDGQIYLGFCKDSYGYEVILE